MTNATKALLGSFLNSGLALLVAFGVTLTNVQQGAILLFVNSGLAVWVALTYKDSPKRVDDK